MRRTLAAYFVTGFFVVLTAHPAQAHTWTDYYTYMSHARWSESNDHQVQIYHQSAMSGTNFKARALDGAKAWEGHNGAGDFDFESAGEGSHPFSCAASTNRNMIGFGEPLDDSLAETELCEFDADTLNSYNIIFDNDANVPWHAGTGSPDSDEYDVWSAAAHEFGHAQGFWEHFLIGQTPCTFTNYYHTMCEGIPIGTPPPNNGQWMRTLGEHDLDTFIGAY